jgi:hypothetical protein
MDITVESDAINLKYERYLRFQILSYNEIYKLFNLSFLGLFIFTQ